jgi:TPR repeat protein
MKNNSDCLDFLELNYLSFWNGEIETFEDFYDDAFKNFYITAEEFFEYIRRKEQLTNEGLCILGDLFCHGIGTNLNPSDCLQHYQIAANNGYPPAFCCLALASPDRGFTYISNAAASDFKFAVHELAIYYKHGWGVEADYIKSLELFVKAKELGDRKADKSISILVSEVINEVDYKEHTYLNKLQFLIKARDLGIDTTELIYRFLKVIEKERTNEFALKCYTQASRAGYSCEKEINRLKAKIVISQEIALDMLCKDAARELVYIEPSLEPKLFGITPRINMIEMTQLAS